MLLAALVRVIPDPADFCDVDPDIPNSCIGEPETWFDRFIGAIILGGIALVACGCVVLAMVQFFRQPRVEGAPPVVRTLLAVSGIPYVIVGVAFSGLMGSMFVIGAIFGEDAPDSIFRVGQAIGLLPAILIWIGSRVSRSRMRSDQPEQD